MKKEKRKVVATAQKVVETINEKLKKEKGTGENKIDLGRVAKDLAERRERILNEEESNK